MFGFAAVDPERLSEEQRRHYRAVYCGLCRALGKEGPFYARAALTYDFVLPILVLSDLHNEPFAEAEIRCGVHPFRRHLIRRNRFTDYAADMNLLLAYYKFDDDLRDDGGARNRLKTALFRQEALRLSAKYPVQSAAIVDCLSALSEMEAANELRPDLPAAAFGVLLGTVFARGSETQREALFAFGSALGRAVYLMDAAVDLQADLRKRRYNPLVKLGFAASEALLEQELAACMAFLEQLPGGENRAIVKNVLLSGIWAQYETEKQRRERQDDRKSV